LQIGSRSGQIGLIRRDTRRTRQFRFPYDPEKSWK